MTDCDSTSDADESVLSVLGGIAALEVVKRAHDLFSADVHLDAITATKRPSTRPSMTLDATADAPVGESASATHRGERSFYVTAE